MKLFHRGIRPFNFYWNAKDEVYAEDVPSENNRGKVKHHKGTPKPPVQLYRCEARQMTPDLPPAGAKWLLFNFKKRFSADKQAMEAELLKDQQLAEANSRALEAEGKLARIQTLILQASDSKDPKAAQDAAAQLDQLMAGDKPRKKKKSEKADEPTTPAAQAEAAPAAETPPEDET